MLLDVAERGAERRGLAPDRAFRAEGDTACAPRLRIACSAPRQAEGRPTTGVQNPVVVAIESGGEPEPAVEVPAVGERHGLQARLAKLLGERREVRRDSAATVGGAVAIRIEPSAVDGGRLLPGGRPHASTPAAARSSSGGS